MATPDVANLKFCRICTSPDKMVEIDSDPLIGQLLGSILKFGPDPKLKYVCELCCATLKFIETFLNNGRKTDFALHYGFKHKLDISVQDPGTSILSQLSQTSESLVVNASAGWLMEQNELNETDPIPLKKPKAEVFFRLKPFTRD